MILIIGVLSIWTVIGIFACASLKGEDTKDLKDTGIIDWIRVSIFLIIIGPFGWALFLFEMYKKLLNSLVPKKEKKDK